MVDNNNQESEVNRFRGSFLFFLESFSFLSVHKSQTFLGWGTGRPKKATLVMCAVLLSKKYNLIVVGQPVVVFDPS